MNERVEADCSQDSLISIDMNSNLIFAISILQGQNMNRRGYKLIVKFLSFLDDISITLDRFPHKCRSNLNLIYKI